MDGRSPKQTAGHAEKSSMVRRGELFEKEWRGGYPPGDIPPTEERPKARVSIFPNNNSSPPRPRQNLKFKFDRGGPPPFGRRGSRRGVG